MITLHIAAFHLVPSGSKFEVSKMIIFFPYKKHNNTLYKVY